MDTKSGYPDINNVAPPPSYNVAIGFQPPEGYPHQQYPSPQISPQPLPQPQPYTQPQEQIYSSQPLPQVTPAAVPVIINPQVGPTPNPVICPHCRSQIISRVDYESNTKTHLIAALLCLLGLWCCVCIPYCVDECKNANHYCTNCGAFIGSYRN